MALDISTLDEDSRRESNEVELYNNSTSTYAYGRLPRGNLPEGRALDDGVVAPVHAMSTISTKFNRRKLEVIHFVRNLFGRVSTRRIILIVVCLLILSTLTSTTVVMVYHMTIVRKFNNELTPETTDTFDKSTGLVQPEPTDTFDKSTGLVRAMLDNQITPDNVIQTLTETVQELHETVLALLKKHNSSDHQVAFAVNNPSGSQTDEGSPIFRNVVLNVGGAYNNITGTFKCPIAGTYYFSVTLVRKSGTGSRLYCDIRKNNVNKARAGSYAGVYADSASGSVFLQLSVGDTVHLHCYNWFYVLVSSLYTSFTGSLIREN